MGNYVEDSYNRAREQRSQWRQQNYNLSVGTRRAVRAANDPEFDAEKDIETEEAKADSKIDENQDEDNSRIKSD